VHYLVLSDIHANLEALEAVLADAGGRFDRVLVLGDLVGYGAEPNAVVQRVRGLPLAAIIRGNHDKVAVGIEPSDSFNHHARMAIEWTARVLTPENVAYLAQLPAGPLMVDDFIEICHGTPFDEDVYVFDELEANRSLDAAARPLCLYGHTHVAAAFHVNGGALHVTTNRRDAQVDINVGGAGKWLVNCGSVGQPRDADWRAAYGLVDAAARTVSIIRVEYDVAATQAKIIDAGLPELLAQRLRVGR
jgi:diadenosine tetraphosphatase ApaH/serine/threonine PP2A family protein phosphatase